MKLIENNKEALVFSIPVVEQPASKIRSIMRRFSSELENKPWFYDKEYWQYYLAMLVSSRVNKLNFTTGMSFNSAKKLVIDTCFSTIQKK